MSHLVPYPLAWLAQRMLREFDRRQSIFDLPARKFVLGDARRDVSVRFHGQVAATPFGPAAGPQTQLAQNIVLSWLAGGRAIELKTVQVNDRLTLPRPCIDMQTLGYNVEWSQELTLAQSLEEYVKAAMLIRILEASGRLALAPGFGRTVFDMSVGYDLAGVQSTPVQAFIRGMSDASAVVERLRRQLPAELGPLRDLDFPTRLSSTLTLSTFHGCPPSEIEAMATHLMRENGLSCVVKLNPTLLGARTLRGLLHDTLGYTELRVPDAAFERDTTWEQASAFMDRLAATGRELGLGLGVKFSNTLLVDNHRSFFPVEERSMYLSGPPLHVLAMHLVQRWRQAFGDRFTVSFSAGIERSNYPDAVALGLVPVTACTDLLKPGGYGRGFLYFHELIRRMAAVGASTIDQFVQHAYGDDGPQELSLARLRNTALYVDSLAGDARYRADNHRALPRKSGRALALFDCETCDQCIPVCPNAANFSLPVAPSIGLPLTESRQIVNFADFCNDCGNCDVFCPEDGGPNRAKPRLFIDRERWLADAPRDAILVEHDAISGRFDGAVLRLARGQAPGDDPREQALHGLRLALDDAGAVNHVSEALRHALPA
jgi:putative selenate reductase